MSPGANGARWWQLVRAALAVPRRPQVWRLMVWAMSSREGGGTCVHAPWLGTLFMVSAQTRGTAPYAEMRIPAMSSSESGHVEHACSSGRRVAPEPGDVIDMWA